jgi:hypothetical protein
MQQPNDGLRPIQGFLALAEARKAMGHTRFSALQYPKTMAASARVLWCVFHAPFRLEAVRIDASSTAGTVPRILLVTHPAMPQR